MGCHNFHNLLILFRFIPLPHDGINIDPDNSKCGVLFVLWEG